VAIFGTAHAGRRKAVALRSEPVAVGAGALGLHSQQTNETSANNARPSSLGCASSALMAAEPRSCENPRVGTASPGAPLGLAEAAPFAELDRGIIDQRTMARVARPGYDPQPA